MMDKKIETRPITDALSVFLCARYQEAKGANTSVVEGLLLECLRQRKDEHDPRFVKGVKGGKYPPFVGVTRRKCDDAQAWLEDAYFSNTTMPWEIKATNELEVANDKKDALFDLISSRLEGLPVNEAVSQFKAHYSATQKALEEILKDKIRYINDFINKQLEQGGFLKAVKSMMYDLVTYPAAFIEMSYETRKVYVKGSDDRPKIVEKLIPIWNRVSPFDIVPGIDNKDVDDGYVFVKSSVEKAYLSSCKNDPSYNSEMIDRVLGAYKDSGYSLPQGYDYQREAEENRPFFKTGEKIEIKTYYGKVSGHLLQEWGYKKAVDPLETYDIWAILAGEHYVIKCVLNPNPFGHIPLYRICFEEQAGSFWGAGIPQMIKDIQADCNNLFRWIVLNAGMSAMPQTEVNMRNLESDEDIDISAGKVWKVSSQMMADAPSLRFTPLPITADRLIPVFEFINRLADTISGIPPFIHTDNKGASATASGSAMLQRQASRTIQSVLNNIDTMIVKAIHLLYDMNIKFHDDCGLDLDMLPDADIIATGSSSLMAKEQRIVRLKDALTTTLNPVDMQIVGLVGRREMLQELFSALDIPYKIPEIPSPSAGGVPPSGNADGGQGQPQQTENTPQQNIPQGGQMDINNLPMRPPENNLFQGERGQ